MKISLQTDTKEITLGILKSTRSGMNAALHKAANGVRTDLMNMADGLLRRSPG